LVDDVGSRLSDCNEQTKYEVRITTLDKAGVKSIEENVKIPEFKFIPIMSMKATTGQAMIGHQVKLSKETDQTKYGFTDGFISHVQWVTDPSREKGGFHEYTVTPLAGDEEGTMAKVEQEDFIDLEMGAEASKSSYITNGDMHRMNAVARKFHNQELRTKRTETLSPELVEEYKNVLKETHGATFPDDDAIQAVNAKHAANIAAEVPTFGNRHELLLNMLNGLMPDVVRSRILAGDDDVHNGIEHHVDQWAKEGLKTLGAARGSTRLAKNVLVHFERAHQQAMDPKTDPGGLDTFKRDAIDKIGDQLVEDGAPH